MMQQIILLRGWTPKENYKDYYDFLQNREINPYEEKKLKWSDTLWKKLWDNFEILEIQRPNKNFADYKARKIIFEKYLPYIKQWAIFIGHSLWWSFFLKYMEENIDILEKIKKVFLIAPACKDSENEVLWSFKFDLNFRKQRFIGFLKFILLNFIVFLFFIKEVCSILFKRSLFFIFFLLFLVLNLLIKFFIILKYMFIFV